MGRQLSLLLMFTGMAVALAVWVIATNFWSLAAFAFVYEIFYRGWVAVLPAVVMIISAAAMPATSSAFSAPVWRSAP
jgi:hypothetical protein